MGSMVMHAVCCTYLPVLYMVVHWLADASVAGGGDPVDLLIQMDFFHCYYNTHAQHANRPLSS